MTDVGAAQGTGDDEPFEDLVDPSNKRLARIEGALDKRHAGTMPVSPEFGVGGGGGIRFRDMRDVMEFSKLLALDECSPKHLVGKPSLCLRVTVQALEWGLSPYSLADKSYFVSNKLAYESQVVHALIETRAPLEGRLRHRFDGEGDERVCIVWGMFKGEDEAHELRSPPFGKILPKNSPLWKTKPDVQQFYNTSRDWARVHCPEVILGLYAKDDLEDNAALYDQPATPNLRERLKGKAIDGEVAAPGEGFSEAGIEAALATDTDTGELPSGHKDSGKEPAKKPREPEPEKPKPAEKGADPKKKGPPKNEAEYIAHATALIFNAKSASKLDDDFAAERKLRTAIGVSIDAANDLKDKIKERKRELKGAA